MRTPTVGPVTYCQLLARFGSPAAAPVAVLDLARRGGGKPPVAPPRAAIETEVETVEAAGARCLFLGLPGYPAMLATIPTAPPALIVRGKRALADRPAVGMVAARNASRRLPLRARVDEIVCQSLRPPAIVQTVQLKLELAGRLQRHAGGQVSVIG